VSHWLDRLARMTVERDLSRRGVFKGAAVAAFAASPLASQATADAARRLEAKAADIDCQACLNATIRAHNKAAASCDKDGSAWGPPPTKKKGKASAKSGPVTLAQRFSCLMNEWGEFSDDLNTCRTLSCAGASTVPARGAAGRGGGLSF
jgi:hypothetical protein